MNFTLSVIILAAGKSLRFGDKIKKQFYVLNKIPVVEYSVKTFHELNFVNRIVVVLPEEDLVKYRKIINQYSKASVVCGGKERYNSVQNGLKKCFPDTTYIAIHDAARPLVSRKIILNCVRWLKKYDGVVPGIKVCDTLKYVNAKHEIEKHIDRTKIFAVQTPQMFKSAVVKKIYSEKVINKWSKKYTITDDTQLAQLEGYKIKVIEGEKSNLKITSKEDLDLLKFYLNGRTINYE
ncbi:MAG: 2-C-methyl-D-erythritol 4-phosphate cytidylyltransferase [Endomicrobiia bacterium]